MVLKPLLAGDAELLFAKVKEHTNSIKKSVDAHLLVLYDHLNTGKEVIQKFMSSNHSEVAAA